MFVPVPLKTFHIGAVVGAVIGRSALAYGHETVGRETIGGIRTTDGSTSLMSAVRLGMTT